MKEFQERLMRLPHDTRESLAFFTRLPVGSKDTLTDLRISAAAWPLAGGIIVLVPAILLWLAVMAGMPSLIAAVLALALAVAITGGLHEDGLADTADGFGGGETRERKLEIMRDSRLGSYGALALIFVIMIRVMSLAMLSGEAGRGAIALFSVALVSRTLALWHWSSLEPARNEGLAFSAGRPDWRALAIGAGVGVVGLIALLFAFGTATLFAAAIAFIVTIAFTSLSKSQIGGHTGDTIGACQQVAEAALLAGLTVGWQSYAPV
ncbi:MAG TPA: adenosylcobinamide-GDP ribazoletransferase [Afifellaceae bacterium]|nr:adenosylcobinamide-GDP ribazoletransferase [Afifellaceae bacterium]